MPAVKLRVPVQDIPLLGDGSLPSLVKSRLAWLLSGEAGALAPAVPRQSLPTHSATVWLSDDQHRQLLAMEDFEGAGPAATALLHGWATHVRLQTAPTEPVARKPSTITTLDRINHALSSGDRPDQQRFFQQLAEELALKRPAHEVILAEASTGIGKSRAFLAAGWDWLQVHPGEHVVLSAPSYNVLLQTITEWQRIQAAFDEAPDAMVVLGQREFVSRDALARVLEEHPEAGGADAARRWLNLNGPPTKDDPLGHHWLARSLRQYTDQQWDLSDHVHLESDTPADDPGMLAYRQQFTSTRDTPLVFCTHAMLATEVRLRTALATKAYIDSTGKTAGEAAWAEWGALEKEEQQRARVWELRNDLIQPMLEDDPGRLPRIGLLIVDEAHLLEQSFAQAFASGASISRMMTTLRKLKQEAKDLVKAQELEELHDVWTTLRAVGQRRNTDAVSVDEAPELALAVGTVRTILGRILARKSAKRESVRRGLSLLKEVSTSLQLAAQAPAGRMGMSTRVSWSPNEHWPSIQVGRYDVSRELDFLWSLAVQDRSVLVSATLYDDFTQSGIEGIRRILAVRSSAGRYLPPVRPRWLYDPVQLHLVADTSHPDGLKRFRRPTQRDKLNEVEYEEQLERWRNDLTQYICHAYTSAAGGMLVLMTSHAERAELAARLQPHIPTGLLVVQHDGAPIDALRARFKELSAAGGRPCMLAVGAGWTGLDLSDTDSPADQDNLLTDLVIPTAPIGTNRSLTHEWRRQISGVMPEFTATSMMFRQGIGRLVRRDGLPLNRRLHFLDSRIHESAWAPFFKPIRKALEPYSRRVAV